MKSWEFRWKRDGAVRGIVLGNYPEIGIKAARVLRDRHKAMIAEGRDPRAQRAIVIAKERQRLSDLVAKQVEKRAAQGRVGMTFENIALEWAERHRATWTEQHGNQVEQSLRDHVFPIVGERFIDSIETSDILSVLDALLAQDMLETASRVKQRLSAIYEFAGMKYAVKIDPTSLVRKEFSGRLKRARRGTPVQNFATVNPSDAPALLRALDAYSAPSGRLVRFLSVTACRTGEARGAKWSEFDLASRFWTIPAERMKARKGHVVPLSAQAIAIVEAQRRDTANSEYVFPNPTKPYHPASENSALYVLAAIGYKHKMTGHGFRSQFSTIANESGKWRAEVIETALAHTEQDDTRAAYLRTSYLDERRNLMEWWADELDRLKRIGVTESRRVHYAANRTRRSARGNVASHREAQAT